MRLCKGEVTHPGIKRPEAEIAGLKNRQGRGKTHKKEDRGIRWARKARMARCNGGERGCSRHETQRKGNPEPAGSARGPVQESGAEVLLLC